MNPTTASTEDRSPQARTGAAPSGKDTAAQGTRRQRGSVLSAVGGQNLSLIGALILVLALFGSLNSAYLTWANIKVIGDAVTISGLLALVQTVVIVCGALDISVGSQVGVASVVSAMVFTSTGSNALLGIAAALGVGVLAGLLNGAVIVYGRVNPVIATLATLAAYKGVAQLLSKGAAQGYVSNDDVFVFLANGAILGVPVLLWVLALVTLGIHVLLKFTDIGRNIYAIGGNDTAARLSGININKYLIAVYGLAGVIAAVAGVLLTARTGFGHPVSGSEGLELKAITAAALGGCLLAGGRGGVGGTLLAITLLGALDNGLTVQGVNPFWQNVAQGTLLVVAVVIQKRRSGERAMGLPT
ncbi:MULTISPECIES: ABC transporter permease [unclassified Streptomyces]|uniref:ABC transporter permease n=1 Tax=unclassified Streptomyces TaxID=2593676 RepID=UPI001BE8EA17|nr:MULTISPECIES: ABC transporter permease [unclassified Streptomyces]MBT2406203.1 ABC transporter permease [Streptomyces sp. ISL-21]MBT2609503.1 ABC transporter permease [Streptomyces sp. ISL-87]